MHDFRETLYTIDKQGRRKWVYPAIVRGLMYKRRAIVVYALMAFYLIMPWITINNEQGIHLDIIGRRFIIFGQVFWATDTSFLVMVLATLGLTLFFVSAVAGRAWCGWACPETVFLEFLFRPIEQLIEGPPAARLKLDQSPWTAHKIFLKGSKLVVYSICAWILSSTFLAYFVGREPLLRMMMASPAENPTPFIFTVATMGLMLFQFGWFREQFCTIVCPYARFQSVLLDQNSIVVGYDFKRGEPRGKVVRDADAAPRGDCIDCGLCVRVCPTGIDIRNGIQLECIHCASCIDACNSIMEKISKPPGLIRYTTEERLNGKPGKMLRPRVFVYAFAILAIVTVFIYRLNTRSMIDVQVLRGAGDVPFTLAGPGKISNHLSAHIGNKDRTAHSLSVTLGRVDDVSLITPLNPFPVGSEQLQTMPLFLTFPASSLTNGKRRIVLHFTSENGFTHDEEVTLVGPGN